MHYSHASYAMCATTQLSLTHLHHAPSGACAKLSYLYTAMCEMNPTKTSQRQGDCLGCCAWVHKTVRRIESKYRKYTIYDIILRWHSRAKRINTIDTMAARIQITRSQENRYARMCLGIMELTHTQYCQSVWEWECSVLHSCGDRMLLACRLVNYV